MRQMWWDLAEEEKEKKKEKMIFTAILILFTK